jgi:hypothetical protein
VGAWSSKNQGSAGFCRAIGLIRQAGNKNRRKTSLAVRFFSSRGVVSRRDFIRAESGIASALRYLGMSDFSLH